MASQVVVVATKVAWPALASPAPTARPCAPGLGLAASGIRAAACTSGATTEAGLAPIAGAQAAHEGLVRRGRPVGRRRLGGPRALGQAGVPVAVATAGLASPTAGRRPIAST